MSQESLGTDQLLPFERAESPADVNKSLFAALDSEYSEEAEGADEPTDEGDAQAPEAESDDAESEELADDEEPDESDEDGEADEEDEAPEPLHRLRVDGKEVEVSLQELKDGYSRQQDYTRKTQALAEDRRKAEAEATQLRGARDQYAERLEALATALKQAQPTEPDWDKLKAENPTEYVVQREDFRRLKERQQEVEAEQRRVYEERLADWEAQQEAYLAAESAKLHEAIPEWKDEAKAKVEKGKLADYVTKTYGWTNDDLAAVTDHRLMLVLRKAMLYDESQTVGKEKIRDKVKPAVKVLKPGVRERVPNREIKSERKRARNALAKSGRTEDAARLFETFLDD